MYQQQYQQGGYAPQNQNQNTYVGSAKFQQGQYGLMVSVSLNAEDIAKLQAHLNENGWVTFSLRERQQPNQSGATHYGVIRPPMPQGGYQQGANWNGQNGPVGQVGQRGNQWNGARGQGYQQRPPMSQGGYRQAPPPPQYQQPAPPPPPPQYDNGGFNQAPPPPQYQQPAPPPQNPAPAQHRYNSADAQPPVAGDGQEPPIDNDMPM